MNGPAFRFGARLGIGLLGEIAIVLGTLLVLFLLVYPTAWVILASFRTPETMFLAGRWDFTLANYATLMKSGFWRNILTASACASSASRSRPSWRSTPPMSSRASDFRPSGPFSPRSCSGRPFPGSCW